MQHLKYLSRRELLEKGVSASFLAAISSQKPLRAQARDNATNSIAAAAPGAFSSNELKLLDAVLMQLFPDDGNGPDARALNALEYLQSAMQDPGNIADGDPDFIKKGCGWLDDMAQRSHKLAYYQLNGPAKNEVLLQIANSATGENWLSLIMYYLTEALCLDPIYGGNPGELGWAWLEHQAGFPRPVAGKTYRNFD